ncbi:MAG TPA: LLM class F420-dependent oxidoreductase [Candidatus Binatia bacterium]|nr:LLM class F420-dependent oxidoreductase [Candidatus Binatia bacterium]
MKHALTMFPTDDAIRPDELARAAEERGFEALFVPEHTHIPCSRKTPYPAGGDLPREYYRTHDPFVALALAAGATNRIKLATGICLVIERDPIVLAKEVASLDYLSNGRAILGIGAGWNVEEMANHGTEFKSRWQVLRERVEAMKAIWQNERAQYRGKFVSFDPVFSYPKPVQKPHPPVLLGGHGPKALERVVRYCDGWMPISLRAGDIKAGIADLRRLAEKAGRDPRSISVSVFWAPADRQAIDGYEAIGVERAIFPLPPAPRDQVMPILDKHAKLIG